MIFNEIYLRENMNLEVARLVAARSGGSTNLPTPEVQELALVAVQ
jgi:hypothetical protein